MCGGAGESRVNVGGRVGVSVAAYGRLKASQMDEPLLIGATDQHISWYDGAVTVRASRAVAGEGRRKTWWSV